MIKLKSLPLLLVMLLAFSSFSMASSKSSIDKDANEALAKFYNEVSGSKNYLHKVKAYLVFHEIKEAGMFFGGKYGEGVLRIGNTSKAYYSITSASVGMQMGVQMFSMVIAITSDAALNRFLLSDDDWETEVDGKIAIAEWNSKEELDDYEFDDDMVAFVFDSKGMMGSFTMEGTRFKRIKK